MNKNIEINTFSYDKTYLEQFDFIMENSLHLPIELVRYAESVTNKKDNIQLIDNIVNCYNISEDIEKGIFESSLKVLNDCCTSVLIGGFIELKITYILLFNSTTSLNLM